MGGGACVCVRGEGGTLGPCLWARMAIYELLLENLEDQPSGGQGWRGGGGASQVWKGWVLICLDGWLGGLVVGWVGASEGWKVWVGGWVGG